MVGGGGGHHKFEINIYYYKDDKLLKCPVYLLTFLYNIF